MNEKYKDIGGVLIYPRVSSEKQVREGQGLSSQETLCREFVKGLGLGDKIEAVFPEEMTGRLFDRPMMQALIRHIDEHKPRKYLVVFDDLKRFARDVETHLRLKREFGSRGAVFASPNFNFEDTPAGRFVEIVIAGTAQLEREQNAVQVKDKMRARMLNGCWSLPLPSEYRYMKDPQFGKVAVIVPELADPLRRLFEAIDQRKVVGLENACEFLQQQYDQDGINKKAALETVRGKLTNRLYTGVVEYAQWAIEPRKGVHEPIVSPELFERVQDILMQRSIKPSRKDYRKDFPLRGRILCFLCRSPLTASWNRGRTKRYPNYCCYNKHCPVHTVALAREIVEPRFEEYLKSLKPRRRLILLVQSLLNSVWQDERDGTGAVMLQLTKEVGEKDRQVKAHLENACRTSSIVLREEYERLATEAVNHRDQLQEDIRKLRLAQANEGFGTALEKVLSYMSEPVRMWQSGDSEDREVIIKMYFGRPPIYDPEYGFGTTELTCLVEMLQVRHFNKNAMVDYALKSWNQIVEDVTRWSAILNGRPDLSVDSK